MIAMLLMTVAACQDPVVQLPVPSGGGATVIIKEPSSPIREVQEFAAATDRFRAANENISARAGAVQTLAGAAVLVETARERAISNASTEIRSRWAIQDEAGARQRRRQRWIDWQEESLDLRERLGRLKQREAELVQAGIVPARPESRAAINGVEWRRKE